MSKKILIAFLVLVGLIVAWLLISPLWRNVALDEALPDSEVVTLSRGEMTPREHEVSGQALFIKDGDKTYLRFENLNTVNGPDLRIYLSSDLTNNDFIDLGPIRATQGNVNYEIPAGTDLAKYHNALIWCRTFRVLFSYAEL